MSTEAQARITINHLLEEAGWRFVADGRGRPANIVCEHRVKKRRLDDGNGLGADFEHAPGGFVDYVLQNTDGRAVAVVEAKRESIEPLTAKEQARAYAESLGVAHIFLSNGLAHYYWNLRQGNPTRVSRFLPLEELGKAAEWQPDPARMAAIAVDENYIAVSQDAAWLGYTLAEQREAMTNKKIRLLRDYQIAGVHALQRAAAQGKDRFLFEMATGTGKTLLSAAIAKLYLRTDNAQRVLFLVDRLELESQALGAFAGYLANDGIETVIYKQRRDDWKQAQVVVTTIQSLAAHNRFLHEFAPTDFQLVISDEAHRTISGNNRAIFEYFVGAKLGLTATPKDYLKGVNQSEMQENDPRALERRLLLDTYTTFGCGDGAPTYRFSLVDAVRHDPPYLVNPLALDARTEITTKMLSEKGYAVAVPADEDGKESEIVFIKKDYERKFFSDDTNLSFARCFLENALRDPLTGEIGKTIFFAVSRRHATKLVTQLNEVAAYMWPEAYGAGSAFAVQVTSDVPGAQLMTIQFAHNNLNGKSCWQADDFRDYDTSRTRVCVTVGMMTTGYNCDDILNVVLARPMFSPTDFIQIKGRGTRPYSFKHGAGAEARTADKKAYALFDFFGNCEYFEDDFDYDAKLKLPEKDEGGWSGDDEGGGEWRVMYPYTNTSPDPIAVMDREEIGAFGMKIDREMYRERFAEQAREATDADSSLHEAVKAENWSAVESLVRQKLFDKPEEFWNLLKLQKVYSTDRNPSLREILLHVFGLMPAIPTRAQLADEAYERFAASQPFRATQSRSMQEVFNAYLLSPEARKMMEEGRFAEMRACDAGLHEAIAALTPNERASMMAYLRAEVPLDSFLKAA
ncbi:MAG: DEAD/DEAH box helicase family protein [Candidatus Sumerlaeota bacterium]|nr:DEAD/DEAH box helicase family protein [Candidatus Sumerlaeota bacterium]